MQPHSEDEYNDEYNYGHTTWFTLDSHLENDNGILEGIFATHKQKQMPADDGEDCDCII